MTRPKRILIIIALAGLLGPFMRAQVLPAQRSQNLVVDAVVLFNDRKFEDAAKMLKAALALDEKNDAAYYYLGMCEMYLDESEAAEGFLREAVSLDSGNYWYRYRLAQLYSFTNRPELTVAIYEELLRDFPKKDNLYFELIDLYSRQNQPDKALEVLDSVESSFGKSESTAQTRASLLNAAGRQSEAMDYLKTYNEEFASAWVLSVLGDYEMSMYNDSTAIAHYDEALSLETGYPPALLGKAEAYRMTRRYDEYFGLMYEFMSDRDIVPAGKTDYLKAMLDSVDPRFFKNFRPQVDSMYSCCLAAHPSDTTLLATAGIYYFRTDRGEQSKKCFLENVSNHPDQISHSATYTQVLMYLEDWNELYARAREYYGKFPQEPAFLEMAALAKYNLGDYRAVLDCYQELLSVATTPEKIVSCLSSMGDMYHELGETDKACKTYEKALKIDPDYVPVLNNYAYYLSLDGKKLKKAYAMSKKTIEKEPDNPTYLDTFAWILHLMGNDLEAKPFFKHAMLYGGKESATILSHYADVLDALGESELAKVYRRQAESKKD